jgi:hypothetical protein
MNLFKIINRKYTGIIVPLIILLFTGCQVDDNDSDFVLEGIWKSPYDSYTITKTTVDYFMDNSSFDGDNGILKGSIEENIKFTANAGVLIIKVTESAAIGNTVGYFTGIYYSDGTNISIRMANAINADYSPAETSTLAAAKSTFTVDNVGNHVSMWGTYTR